MLRLDVGLPRSMWTVWLSCLLPTIALANLMVGAISLMFLTSSEFGVIGVFLLLPLLILDVFIALMLLHHYRDASWLDGRVLVRRLVFARRRYDLAAAQVSAESVQPVWTNWRGGVLPRLVVQVPGRAPAKLWLRDPARRGALLPSAQLAALARAIDPDLRHPIAGKLWQLASDPLPGII
ncbi:hypothetical protein [Actinomadura chokoriensis]|uniref:PH domain-containing protein n=1 Tax=Actinomadura chokoriensis TaxID=454156 RepID=A0ABV4QQ37_9ACTN